MKNKTGVLSLAMVLLLSVAILLPGCTSSGNQGTTTPADTVSQSPGIATQPVTESSPSPAPSSTAASTTEFGRFLSRVPASFLQKHDIWFGDLEKARELKGIQDINGLASLMSMSSENRKALLEAQSAIALVSNWRNLDLAPLTGFDAWMIDRTAFTEIPPPWSFSINEGDFNEELIKGKLVEQEYKQVKYGSGDYYSINEDYSINLDSQLGKLGVMANLNRIAVLDNTLVTAVTTEALTGILDAMSDKEPSVLDNTAGQALAASLGQVLSGVIMNPERVLNINPPQEIPPFDFAIPADWGLLHQYDMAGMGYKYGGKERSWVISLYYTDPAAARADAAELIKRLNTYVFNTQILNPQLEAGRQGLGERTPLTDRYTVGGPVIQQYPGGATLTVECRGQAFPSGLLVGMRDLLFLAPDPAPYVTGPSASTHAPQPPLGSNETRLNAVGNTYVNTVEKASQLAGYRVATPSFIPDGFFPIAIDGQNGTFILTKIPFIISGTTCEVTQQFSQSPFPLEKPGPLYTLIQLPAYLVTEYALYGSYLGPYEEVNIGGYKAKLIKMPVFESSPGRFILKWEDDMRSYYFEGTLLAPLDEATLLKVADSVGVH
jgi:hypothetical protein